MVTGTLCIGLGVGDWCCSLHTAERPLDPSVRNWNMKDARYTTTEYSGNRQFCQSHHLIYLCVFPSLEGTSIMVLMLHRGKGR